MASIRVAETAEDWGGCGRDSFELPNISIAPQLNRRKLLAKAIEAEIIPRFSLANLAVNGSIYAAGSGEGRPKADQVMEFVQLLISSDVTVASSYVEKMCMEGVRLETMFLHLFTPAARVLGKLWEQDVVDFIDVTIALSRLQQLLRDLGAAFEMEPATAKNGRIALLVAAPGDQHTFGVFILQEFFRRAGWEVRGGAVGSDDELINLVECDRYDLVGLSVSNEITVGAFASVIRTIREVSLSPGLHVMVGGRFFLEHPDCVSGVGADASAHDGRRAVLRVSSLLGTNALR